MSWNLQEALSHYRSLGAPGDQNALIGLLREIQQESGGSIPSFTLAEIAGAYATKESYLRAIIRRIPSLREADLHCLELCAGPNCGKAAALAAEAEALCRGKPNVTLKFVPCMRHCGKLSFSIYVNHALICRFTNGFLSHQMAGLSQLQKDLVFFLLVTVFSVFMMVAVDSIMARWAKKRATV